MRRLSIITLISLLFAGGWGKVPGATFCSQMMPDHSCCLISDATHDAASNQKEMMVVHGMEIMPSCASETNESVQAIGQKIESSCAHCLGRPQTPAAPFTMHNSVEQVKRFADSAPSDVTASFVALASKFLPPVSLDPSAPPGTSFPRHVLINVFRI